MSKRFTSFLVLAAAVLLALPAQAQTFRKAVPKEFKAHKIHKFTAADALKGKDAAAKWAEEQGETVNVPLQATNNGRKVSRPFAFNVVQAPLKIKKATGEEVDANGIITKPGEGVRKVYTTSGQGYKYNSGIGGSTLVDQSGETVIVECEDGTIYIQNIVSTYASGAWVKGTKVGNTITVPTKQPIIYNTNYSATMSPRWATGDGTDGNTVAAADDIADYFTFIVDDVNNTISLQDTNASQFMAVLWDDNNSYSGNGVFETVYTYSHDYVAPQIVTITPPATLEAVDWYAKGHTRTSTAVNPFKYNVSVGFDGNDVYLKGMFSSYPDAWMKGTLEGNKVTFTGLQIQGTYGTSYTIYATGTDGTSLKDFVMTYDAEAGTLTADNYLLANAAEDRVYYLTWISDVVISKDAPEEEAATTGDPVDEIPYTNAFDTADDFAQFGVIDSNEDDKTWTFAATGEAQYSYHSTNNADDWLISPAIKLTAGVKYRVAFDARAQSASYTESVELKVGKEAKASVMTQTAIAATDVTSTAYETVENEEFTVAEDGYYYFGIHAVSAANAWNLYVDNFVVELGLKPGAPAAPSIEVLAGNQGDQTATVKVTAPTKNAAGEDLTENLTKIEVLRDGNVIGEITDVEPGTMHRFFDEPAAPGTYTYQAIPYNTVGKGVKGEKISLYIGVDTPEDLAEAEVEETANGLNFTWTPVGDTGVHGGFVDPTKVTYKLWTVELVSFWGMVFPELDQEIGSATNASSASADFDTEEGETQEFKYFAVQPTNETGAGAEAYTSGLMVGKSYALPFFEGFTGASLHYYWATNANLMISEEATDDDGIALDLMVQELPDGGQVYLQSGKVDIKTAANPMLIFDAKSPNVGQLYVLAAKDGGQFNVLETVNLTADYQNIKISLASLKDSRYVQFAFIAFFDTAATFDNEGYVTDKGSFITMDAIRVVDLFEYNLGIDVTAPAKLVAGKTAKVVATVENKGEFAAGGYTVTIKAGNNELLKETVDEELAPFKKNRFEADFETTVFDNAADVTITATVEFANELEPDDNEAETLISVTEPTAPSPINLTATDNGEEGVALKWDAPSSSVEETTEDVEAYEEFENGGLDADVHTGKIGEWTVYDGNGKYNYGFNGITVPNMGGPGAWFVMAPASEQLSQDLSASYAAHSGAQYFLSACNAEPEGAVEATDKWLISPALPGVAQTISFYVRELVQDYGAETFEILASSTDTNPESFTLVETKTTSAVEWEEVTVDLPAGTVYFAIRHTSTDVWGLMVDDIVYLVGGGSVASYNVYYEGDLIATVEGGVTTYTVAADKVEAGKRRTFDVTAVYANGAESKPATVNVTIATAIEQLAIDGKPVDVYTLDGRLVRQQTRSFAGLKGVYVINGKAVMIK